MFNRALILRGGETHHHTTVNQQPNDAADSARLLGELEDKAKDKVLGLIHTEADNQFRIVAYEHMKDYAHPSDRYRVAFTINGHQYTVKIAIDDYERAKAGNWQNIIDTVFIPVLAKELAYEIANRSRNK